ncbi:MAG: dihydrofolate reductase [Spirochaetaceae bacterium]|nr:dihydrofolate reductase [Myxococcales bacterium]MCA9608104.1 dihydrofolate reductase [Myxococcales bacterium]MCB9724162.1 dihydrofolate reductase [Spirochaetaceae bacterium]HPG27850.1 dihydrofolate reductase [Myxococcota bacterium]
MRVSLVVAAARNGVIGHQGGIPWRLPDDQRFFRELTTGHCIVLGRRTFESIGRALPRRLNLVLTRRPHDPVPEVEFLPDLEAALALARERGFAECFIVGGEALYRDGLALASRVYRTLVEAEPEGDTFFPALDEKTWRLVRREPHPIDERHAHAFAIETWERR